MDPKGPDGVSAVERFLCEHPVERQKLLKLHEVMSLAAELELLCRDMKRDQLSRAQHELGRGVLQWWMTTKAEEIGGFSTSAIEKTLGWNGVDAELEGQEQWVTGESHALIGLCPKFAVMNRQGDVKFTGSALLWDIASLAWWQHELTPEQQGKLMGHGALGTKISQRVLDRVGKFYDKNPNLVTIGDVIELSRGQISRMQGIGPKLISMIAAVLRYHLCETPDNWHYNEPVHYLEEAS